MNSTVREDNINDAIQSILLFAGIKVDISLIQNIVPTVLRACIKPNMIIDQEATDEARTTAMETVEPVLVVQGESIVREGDRITRNQLEMLRQLGMLNDDTLDYSSYWGSVISVLLSMMMRKHSHTSSDIGRILIPDAVFGSWISYLMLPTRIS